MGPDRLPTCAKDGIAEIQALRAVIVDRRNAPSCNEMHPRATGQHALGLVCIAPPAERLQATRGSVKNGQQDFFGALVLAERRSC